MVEKIHQFLFVYKSVLKRFKKSIRNLFRREKEIENIENMNTDSVSFLLLKETGIIKTKIEKRIERDLQSDDIRLFITRQVSFCLLMSFFMSVNSDIREGYK